ncbi:GNAT family N-acetyltransferase [Parahaliea aestuarii]|uniref:GNAT family N-acetyltransferase n=1 Tax=Parahaliea aestuarii TaxID=1852021 RepID=A0A5C8ZVC3_9GAMM|nr:GNAT family N-acetyltransferase [Parahaliea aestuarii]TXS92473.1 GNAT family N-acetyltransferase [Parahaliea aestuarii]
MTRINIRPATPQDVGLIRHFVRELAEYEKALEEAKASEQDFHQALFSDNPKVWSVICEIDSEPAGFALYFFNYSTWTGKHGLFLEDLYVSPEYRGSGAGKALLKHLAQIAVQSDCRRFEWNVLDWNQSAIDFYESFGARPQSEWVGYRLTGQALRDFASSQD